MKQSTDINLYNPFGLQHRKIEYGSQNSFIHHALPYFFPDVRLSTRCRAAAAVLDFEKSTPKLLSLLKKTTLMAAFTLFLWSTITSYIPRLTFSLC